MMSLVIGFGYIWASPDSVIGELSRGMFAFGRVGLIAVQVAVEGVDLNNDVLGNLGLYGLSFDHLDKGNVLLVSLCGRDLALHL